MNLKELVIKNRSYRRFDNSINISTEILKEFVEIATHTASSRNIQPLQYIISNTKPENDKIFEHIKWARALPDWEGPAPTERPTAYITILHNTQLSTLEKSTIYDAGIAAQTILLAATEKELGGCMIANIQQKKLINYWKLPDYLKILLIIAIGKPTETCLITKMNKNNYSYYRKNNIHYVPKRELNQVIINP